MKSSKDMAPNKPGQAKPTPNGKPSSGNGKPYSQASTRSGSNQPNAARSSSTATKGAPTGRPIAGTTGTRTTTGSGQRPRALPPQKKGFKIRPVDAIVTGVAVLVIALIVFALWSSANPSGTAVSDGTNAGTGITNPDPAADLIKNGNPAPDFTLPANDGKTYSLSQFKGKPVVVEFMAPWCPHCQEDSQYMNAVYDKYSSQGLIMLDVNASPYGRNHENGDNTPISMSDQQWFADTYNVKYPMLFDAPIPDAGQGHPDTKQRMVYGVDYYPSIYFIDKNGIINDHLVADVNSPITTDTISAKVDAIMK